MGCGHPAYLQIWVTKFSPDDNPVPPDNPGVNCAYVDLVSSAPLKGAPSIEYGADFQVLQGAATPAANGGIEDLGACSLESDTGRWPEWALLAQLTLDQNDGGQLSFDLAPSSGVHLNSVSIFGKGGADEVFYGESCAE